MNGKNTPMSDLCVAPRKDQDWLCDMFDEAIERKQIPAETKKVRSCLGVPRETYRIYNIEHLEDVQALAETRNEEIDVYIGKEGETLLPRNINLSRGSALANERHYHEKGRQLKPRLTPLWDGNAPWQFA